MTTERTWRMLQGGSSWRCLAGTFVSVGFSFRKKNALHGPSVVRVLAFGGGKVNMSSRQQAAVSGLVEMYWQCLCEANAVCDKRGEPSVTGANFLSRWAVDSPEVPVKRHEAPNTSSTGSFWMNAVFQNAFLFLFVFKSCGMSFWHSYKLRQSDTKKSHKWQF